MNRYEYGKILGQWRITHFRVGLVAALLLAVAEIGMFFLMETQNYVDATPGMYLLKYVIFPTASNLALIFSCSLLLHRKAMSHQAKNYVVSILLLAVCFVMTIAHGTFNSVYVIFVVPIFMTVVYADKKLTTWITAVAAGLELVSSQLIQWDPEKDITESQPFELAVIYMIIAAVYVICLEIIRYESEKRDAISWGREQQFALQKKLLRDELTGIFNRTAMRRYLDILLEEGRGENSYLAMLDIDDFKRINDTWGHTGGDRVLEKLGEILEETCKEEVPFRYGGEEFVILCQDSTQEKVLELMERIRKGFSSAVFPQIGHLRVTVSIGVARIGEEKQVKKMIDRADAAMYQAKREGKDCIRIFRGEEEE